MASVTAALGLALALGIVLAVPLVAVPAAAQTAPEDASAGADLAAAAEAARLSLRAEHGEAEAGRIDQGITQVLRVWRPEDGGPEELRNFLETEFAPRGTALDGTFHRFEVALESLGGYFTSMVRDLRQGADLDLGPLLPLDRRLAGYNPGAHLADDLFANKVAFVALLNFPITTLQQRLAEGGEWNRRQWAETRLADGFKRRVPAAVSQQISSASATADSYINAYNLYLHHLLTEDGKRLFPPGLRLISHWGLRDELKARYADPEGLPRQQMIKTAFDRIVRQEIPEAVIDNPLLDWTPATNTVALSPVEDAEAPAGASTEPVSAREPDTRYHHWLEVFRSRRLGDPYASDNPTFIDRRFNENREVPEAEVEALFEAILSSPLANGVAELIAQRLGRPLKPFDIWYVGFRPRGAYSEEQLDAITQKRFPTVEAFAEALPETLAGLGFAPERASFLAERIVVEPSRGAGHAFGGARRDDKAHLRTRIGADGMDYKGYNIAVHELGHNVEQVFSVTEIDHTLLQGVPNTAFTEALAFVFQHRDLELLGLDEPDAETRSLKALDTFWATREIAGVALVDMNVWRWLYDHPEATPAEMREAVVRIAEEVWNRFFAAALGSRDQTLLAVYSHMVDGAMYTPDYPLGHLIAFQIESHFDQPGMDFAADFERMAKIGALTPDAWMRQAVAAPLSAKPLLTATATALKALAGSGAETAASMP